MGHDRRNKTETYIDPEGADFPDLPAAVDEAAGAARDIMANDLRSGPMEADRAIDVAADDGQVLATVAFHDCLYRSSD